MIQRIQTIFLLLAALCMAGLFLPIMAFATVSGDTSSMQVAQQSMMADGVFDVIDHVILTILAILATLIAIVAIFMYGDRKKQLLFNRIAIVIGLLVVLLGALFFYQDYSLMDNGSYLISIEYGVLLPIIYIVLLLLASRSIRKDDNLVKSMDRLR